MKKHYADPWKVYSDRYDKLNWAPGKPTEEEKGIYTDFIRQCFEKGKLKNPKILLLGATPAIRDLLAEFDAEVTLLDVNKEMVIAMNKLIKHRKKEKIVEGNWIDMPFEDNEFDIVSGDGVLSNVDKENKEKMLEEIKRVLKPKGFFVARVYFIPEDWKKLPTEDILKKFSDMDHPYDRNTELLVHIMNNTFNPETGEVYLSKVRDMLMKYWKHGKYHYEDKKVEELLNRMHEMWEPYEKIWCAGTKKQVFNKIKKYFDIIELRPSKGHLFGDSFVPVLCRAK